MPATRRQPQQRATGDALRRPDAGLDRVVEIDLRHADQRMRLDRDERLLRIAAETRRMSDVVTVVGPRLIRPVDGIALLLTPPPGSTREPVADAFALRDIVSA